MTERKSGFSIGNFWKREAKDSTAMNFLKRKEMKK